MPNTLSEWSAFLGKPPLPAMTATLRKVAQLLQNPRADNADFQQLIQRDPGFSLALFRHLGNRSGSGKEPPASVAHAVALLGRTPLSRIIESLSSQPPSVDTSTVKGLYRCYSRSVHAARYAHDWGLDHPDSNPDELGLAALFYDCGEMALWAHAPEKMERIEALGAKGMDRGRAALEVLGFPLPQLSSALARQWQLPTLIGAALLGCWHLQSRPMTVMLAAALARASEADWFSEDTGDLIDALAALRKLPTHRASARLHALAAEVARDLHGLPLPVTASALVAVRRPRPAEPAPEHGAAPAAGKHTETTPTPPPKPAVPLAANRVQEHFSRVMARMQKELGLERLLFAMLSSDRKALQARFTVGAEKDSKLRHFALPLEPRNLFGALLAKPQGLWLNDENRERYLPLIPAALHDTIDPRGFFVSSLYVRNKPLGFLYGDCTQPERLNQDHFNRFRQLCLQLCNQLAQRS
jgi:HD-like signal output (HDOD) protein